MPLLLSHLFVIYGCMYVCPKTGFIKAQAIHTYYPRLAPQAVTHPRFCRRSRPNSTCTTNILTVQYIHNSSSTLPSTLPSTTIHAPCHAMPCPCHARPMATVSPTIQFPPSGSSSSRPSPGPSCSPSPRTTGFSLAAQKDRPGIPSHLIPSPPSPLLYSNPLPSPSTSSTGVPLTLQT